MRTLGRYLVKEISGSTLLVFSTLLTLFAFLDLVQELGDLGKGGYGLRHIFLYILLSIPGHVYELFPVAVLIGTLFALANLVANSEYTVMRASGMSMVSMVMALGQTGLLFAALTFIFGEFIAPPAERAAQQLRLAAMETVVAQEFRSGLWVKDETTFVNIGDLWADARLTGVKVYEFDEDFNLRTISYAARGEYQTEQARWLLQDVVTTRFEGLGTEVSRSAEAFWYSTLTPDLLSVLTVAPQQMSALALWSYVRHLNENHLNADRYETALWQKLVYPLASVVMMVLALPFAHFQRRDTGVGAKLFAGIAIGIGFQLLNRLFSHVGLLNDWPPMGSAVAPTAVFLLAAAAMVWWVERR